MRQKNPSEVKRKTLDGSIERERLKGKKELLTTLGFTELDPLHQSIELVARKKYDVHIDSSDSSLGITPEERGRTAAKRILGDGGNNDAVKHSNLFDKDRHAPKDSEIPLQSGLF